MERIYITAAVVGFGTGLVLGLILHIMGLL